MHQRLLIAAWNERQRSAELVQCLARPATFPWPKIPARPVSAAAMPIRHRILPGTRYVTRALRNGKPHRTSGCVAHELSSFLVTRAGRAG